MRLRNFIITTLSGFVLACAASEPPPDPADPRRVSSPNFTIVTESSIDARAILADLEQLRLAALQDWGLTEIGDETEPIVVTFIEEENIYFAIAPIAHAAGYYAALPFVDNIVIFDSPAYSEDDPDVAEALQNITRHETIHALINRHLPFALPHWANEGLAEYYSHYERRANGDIVFGSLGDPDETFYGSDIEAPLRLYAAYPSFGEPGTQEFQNSSEHYYNLAHLLAHHLLENEIGIHALQGWHDAVSSGKPIRDASLDILTQDGLSLEDMMLDRYQSQKPTLRVASGVPVVTIDSVDRLSLDEPEYAAHLRRLVRLHYPLEASERAPVYGRLVQARSDAADYHLARGYEAFNRGDLRQTRTHLDRSLERDPESAGGIYLGFLFAMADVFRGGYSEAKLAKSREAFRDAAAGPLDLPAVYALRVNFLQSLPSQYLPRFESDYIDAEIDAHLDWLQTNRIHARLPRASQILIAPFLDAGRIDYAQELFFTAYAFEADSSTKSRLWQLHAGDFGLTDADRPDSK